MKIVSVTEMVAIEKKADAEGLAYAQMMQNAGSSLARIVMQRYGGLEPRNVLGLVGSGNNGGDTLVALTMMQRAGWKSTAYLVKNRPADDDLVSELQAAGGEVVPYNAPFDQEVLIGAVQANSVILDGILGTGFKLPLRGSLPELLALIALYAGNKIIVAVDCPSGVDCESGACPPETLHADLTVCMAAVKKGMLEQPAIGLMGEIILADIGLPENAFDLIEDKKTVADSTYIKSLLPARASDAHKGTFGRCMVIGGSIPYPGAPSLSAEAAYRVGAGLVCSAIPSSIYDALVCRIPESTWLYLPHEMGMLNEEAASVVLNHSGKYDALLIGPGMGADRSTKEFINRFLGNDRRKKNARSVGFLADSSDTESVERDLQPAMVFDADGLRNLAGIADWHKKIERVAVLTPHPGEMAALTGLTIQEVQRDRVVIAQRFAEQWGHVVVLKGALTVVASPEKDCVIIPIATSALATAGTGDVLAGMVAGYLAQGLAAFDAAIAAAWLHGAAGLYAERQYGQTASVLARDILAQITQVLKNTTAQ
jgi:ADP-dependent NAD(P)H-hydrate dehydratase / NAD(P)H-hydrate epimerase